MVQIVAGLAAGDEVVTSGQFLLDSESRLRESLQKYRSFARAGGAEEELHSPAANPSGSQPPSPSVSLTAAQTAKLDAAARAYLDMADALGAPQKDANPVQADALIAAAHALHHAVAGASLEPAAVGLATSAEAMKGKTIDKQREAFKALSEKFIALVTLAPPSGVVGEKLYIMECPMFPGFWIQRSDELANPFYGTDMKECGSHSGVITTRPAGVPK
jgi:Cu(I)/Ag(I) efflux system membrane fusion protein